MSTPEARRGFLWSLLASAILSSLLGISGCAFITIHDHDIQPVTESGGRAPTNIVLMIGDGMGVGQVTAGRIELGRLNMQRLPVGGMVTTFAGNVLVTDSAASGTALATGHKTRNGAISVSMDGEPLETVLERAELRGMATGLVVTCAVTHATPAVFASHVDNRDDYLEIARQMASSGVDVLFGGGRAYFLPSSEPEGLRKDGLNLIDKLRERMPVVFTPEEFDSIPETDAEAGLFAPEHPARAEMREPRLTELTQRALDVLSRDEDGFFLLVEGSQIDWAGHENDEGWLIAELADFDAAVGVVMDFAEKNGSTLVVVTADHETGAYGVLDGSLELHKVTRPSFGTDSHSAAMVPLLAYGPGSQGLGGISDNAELGRALMEFVSR